MNIEQEKFIQDLVKNCKTEDQWNTLIKFGLPSLVEDKHFFIQLLTNEAFRRNQARGHKTDAKNTGTVLAQLLSELNLNLVEK